MYSKNTFAGLQQLDMMEKKFTDQDLIKYVKKHLRFLDRFRMDRVILASQIAFDVFLGEGKIVSKDKKWKFFDKGVEFKWNEEL